MATVVRLRTARLLAVTWVVLVVVATTVAAASARPAGPGGADPVGVWPLSPTPQVVGTFDPPATPYGAGNRGVDLLGHVGEPVRSALAGTVTYAGLVAGIGVVVVDHGATRTTYEPVAASVHVGDVVARGGRIGTLELAHSHCFPRACLHWGWIADPDTYLDPLRLVGDGPVRLLPLSGLPAPPPIPAARDTLPGPEALVRLLARLAPTL